LQPGVTARCSSAPVGVGKRRGVAWRSSLRCESAWARARSAARSAAPRFAKFSSAHGGGRGRGGARSAARRGVRHVSAWAKALVREVLQSGVEARCPSARVGLGEGVVACRSIARRCGDVFLGACRRGRRRGGLQLSLSTPGGLGRYWTAHWYLVRAVGKRFRGCRAKRPCFHFTPPPPSSPPPSFLLLPLPDIPRNYTGKILRLQQTSWCL